MVSEWVIERFGSVDEFKVQEHAIRKVEKNEVLVRQKAIGINRSDLLQRQGQYPFELPGVLGCEACGVVDYAGSDVIEFKKGDRVAYATAPGGAYAESRVIDRTLLIPVPNYITDEQAASLLTKGMMAHTLLRRTFFVNKDNTILINDPLSGVGQLLCVLAKHYGAKVLASFDGSDEHHKILQGLGVTEAINLLDGNFKEKVSNITKKRGVHAVFDSFGSKTFDDSLECLSDFGLIVNMIESCGTACNFDISKLFVKSAFLTSPDLLVYKKDRAELLLSGNEIFALIEQKVIKPDLYKTYKFSEIKEAQADLESGRVVGQTVIIL
jgi:NADPH2:quinone reductase